MSVLALFGVVKNQFKFGKWDVANNSLGLSRCMGLMLIVFSILTTSKQFFGEPITCQVTDTAVKPNIFQAYCFMNGTYTLRHHDRAERLYSHESHIGITSARGDHLKAVYHTYYQWIPFILFLQGIFFYLPYRVWKHCVGNKISKLLAKLNNDPLSDVTVQDQVEDLARFVAGNPNFFGPFAKKLFGISFLALVQAVLQMYVLDTIFDGQYFGLGCNFYTVRSAMWEYRVILEEMLPMVVGCKYHYFTSAGSVKFTSGVCTLNLNILNQKLFVVSWVLHMTFIAFGILSLIWNLFLVMTPILRYAMLRFRAGSLRNRVLARVHESGCYGQYTLLSILNQNMDQDQFDALLTSIADYANVSKPLDAGFSSDSCIITTGSNSDETLDVRMRRYPVTPADFKLRM